MEIAFAILQLVKVAVRALTLDVCTQVTFKGKLAQLGLSCHPKSWHIVEAKWVDERGGAPPAELDDGTMHSCGCVAYTSIRV